MSWKGVMHVQGRQKWPFILFCQQYARVEILYAAFCGLLCGQTTPSETAGFACIGHYPGFAETSEKPFNAFRPLEAVLWVGQAGVGWWFGMVGLVSMCAVMYRCCAADMWHVCRMSASNRPNNVQYLKAVSSKVLQILIIMSWGIRWVIYAVRWNSPEVQVKQSALFP
eukprot:EG_transcript_27377